MIVPMNNHHTISSNMVTLTMIATGIRAGMITIRGTDSRFHQTVNVTKSDHFPKASAYVLAFFMGFWKISTKNDIESVGYSLIDPRTR